MNALFRDTPLAYNFSTSGDQALGVTVRGRDPKTGPQGHLGPVKKVESTRSGVTGFRLVDFFPEQIILGPHEDKVFQRPKVCYFFLKAWVSRTPNMVF